MEEWTRSNPDFDIADLRENFGDSVADAWAEMQKGDFMKQGFVDHVGQSIEDTVKSQTAQAQFTGKINGEEVPGKVLLFTDADGNEFTLVGGSINEITHEDGNHFAWEIEKGGIAIFRDKDGNLVQKTDMADLREGETLSAEDYANVIRQRLQEQKTAEIQSTETPLLESPNEEPKGEGGKTPTHKERTEENEIKPEPTVGSSTSTDTTGVNHGHNDGATVTSGNSPMTSNGKGKIKSSDSQENNETLTFKDGTPIPMDEKGEPDFTKMTPEQGAEKYQEDFGGEAESVIDGEIKQAEKDLKDAKKRKIEGSSYSEKLKSMNEKKAAEAEAQKKIDTLTEIKKALTLQKVAEGVGEKPKANVMEDASEEVKAAVEKFLNSHKVEGRHGAITLADGTEVEGTYQLVEADALIPSHDPKNGFRPHKGAPLDAEGRTVNDRDYEHEDKAQDTVLEHSANYNGKAVDNVPVVLSTGHVISGNERTMAGQIAAEKGTDKAYVQSLRKNAEGFGLKAEDVDKMEHPRVVFVPDVDMPYTTETFRLFNKEDKKRQGSTAAAIVNAKTLKPNDVGAIVSEIEGNGTLEAFFNNPKATNSLMKTLVQKGIIGTNELDAYIDSNGKLSPEGKEMVKNLLIGSVFSPETIRMMGNDAGLKTKVVNGIRAVLDNLKLGEYSLKDEVDGAVRLLAEARTHGSSVDDLLRQRDAFGENAADRYSNIEQTLAKALEGNATLFRDLMREYNDLAAHENSGEAGLFRNPLSKEELIQEFIKYSNIIKENNLKTYGKERNNEKEGGNHASGDDEHKGSSGGGGAVQESQQEVEETDKVQADWAKGVNPREEKGKKGKDPSDPSEGMKAEAERFHKEKVDNARKAYEDAKASGEESDIKRTRDEYRKALDDKLKAQGVGLVERRKTIAKELGEEAKGEGIDTGEGNKPWKEMTPTERVAKADSDPMSEEEIRNGVSEENEELAEAAVAYINGDKSLLNQIAYLKIYDDVRNRHENVSGNSGTEDGTQLDTTDNGGSQGLGLDGGRTGGGTVEPVDRGTGNKTAPGESESGTTGEGGTVAPAGKQGNSQGKGNTSGLGGLSAGGANAEGSGTAGSQRSVGGRRGRGSSRGSAKSDAKRKPAAKQGTIFPDSKGADLKKETSDAKVAMKAAFAKFKELNKKDKGKLSSSLLFGLENKIPTAEALEYLPEVMKATGRYGIAIMREGIYKAKKWFDSVREAISDDMKDCGFSDEDVDAFIREMWNMPWKMDGETHKICEWASIQGYAKFREDLKEPLRKKFDKQVLAEPKEVKVGDRKNIEETLPFLLPQQQEDVLRAETQFFSESHADKRHAYGKGYMFTNGTGTGKTYTGLGIVKRMVKQGKKRILIVTPSGKKVTDWINDGKNLLLDIKSLEEWGKERGTAATFEKGEGVVITTFANFGLNKRLLEDTFDAIIYDESHRIMENKTGTETARSAQHYMLTNRNKNFAFLRLQEINEHYQKMQGLAKEYDKMRNTEEEKIAKKYKEEHPGVKDKEVRRAVLEARVPDINSGFTAADKQKFPELAKKHEEYTEARNYYVNEVKPGLEKRAPEEAKRTKVVFLSATPFNTRENIEYAEGYLFSYPERNSVGQSGKAQFFLEHFGAGYKYRYNRLESSVKNAEALAKQEVEFSDWLQKDLQTMSGRIIDSPYDYSRDFPIVALEYADRFNEACEEMMHSRLLSALYFKVLGNYNYGSALFETMKVAAMMPRLKEHLALGRKVVIFHRRKESKEPLKAPFKEMLGEQAGQLISLLPEKEQAEAWKEVEDFKRKYADLLDWEKTLNYAMPREQLAKAFGEDNVLFFSGSEGAKAKEKAVEQFNDDDSGKNIIVIQEASGKEGISLHDTTGKHQRVCITLALPQSPITALQIEGRTYRIGNESNAIFEYPLLGLNAEYSLFGSKFNKQVSTTENLALGSQARNLRESFARGIEEHSGYVPFEQQGVGGKEFDRGDTTESDPYDKAILDYYTNQRLNKNNREGVDYFPTPEPLGYKMMEWGNIGEGDTILEPSAGHGAIARYAPGGNTLTAIEPSLSLYAKLQIKAGGTGRKFVNDIFENYHVSNKHDVIVMNPPFGKAGATAIAHLDKAFGHLDEGGRVIAIIPRGATDKKFDKWLEGKKDAALRTEIDLPDILFQQAGTNVRCRVVVLDKITDPKLRSKAGYPDKVDLGGHYDTIEDFFEDLRNVDVPKRIIDTQTKMLKKSRATIKDLGDMKGVWRLDADKNGIMVHGAGVHTEIKFVNGESAEQTRRRMAEYYDQFAHSEEAYSDIRSDASAIYGELKDLVCKLADMTEDEMRRYLTSKNSNSYDDGGVRFRTSEELNKEYGSRWIDEQTNEDGRHTTQVKNTINSYKKFGEFVKADSQGKDVDVLDASSGLGLGTQWMRENGMHVDDVEPYPSKNRETPTYTSYNDVKKKYDYVISNAVLNVIPEDWRADVLHNMADKLKVGGKLVINVRGAQSIKAQGVEGKTRITLDDPSEILVLRPDGSIKAYQKGFTKEELKGWCEKELGNGYSVEVANKKNAGGSYDTAVVVTKNNEEGTIGSSLRASHPNGNVQAVANSNVKLKKYADINNKLLQIRDNLNNYGEFGASEFLHNLSLSFGKNNDNGKSQYVKLSTDVSLRIANHSANVDNYKKVKSSYDSNYGIVIKLSPARFKGEKDVNYLEYVYYPDKLDGDRQKEIIDGLINFINTGDFANLPKADRVNASGRYVDIYKERGFEVGNNGEVRFRKGDDVETGEELTPREREQQKRDANHRTTIEKESKNLNTDIAIHDSVDDIDTSTQAGREAKAAIERGEKVKAWYDMRTGEVHLYMPNVTDKYDAQKSVAHEVVGHKGMRGLLGEEGYKSMMRRMYTHLSSEEAKEVNERMMRNGWDFYTAMDEWVADQAEKIAHKIKSKM